MAEEPVDSQKVIQKVILKRLFPKTHSRFHPTHLPRLPMNVKRGKAVDGLPKLPCTEQEWQGMINKYHLQNNKLRDLCSHGRFSASTVPKEAFLMLRCLWVKRGAHEALLYILETKSFFHREHVQDALALLRSGDDSLDLQKIDTLFDVICEQNEPHTPPSWECSVAKGMGPFSSIGSLKKQIEGKMQNARSKSTSVTNAPRKRGFCPAEDRPPCLSTSPTPPGYDSDGMDLDFPLLHGDEIADEDEIVDEIADQLPDNLPAPQTPTETLVVAFMVDFLAGIASLVQPLSQQSVCLANPYEPTYTFGQTSRHATSDTLFRAQIDGSIPFAHWQPNQLNELVIFEAKRAPRKAGQVGATIMGQQSMEHIAYIWEQHQCDHTPRSAGTHHTIMIAQDYLSFYISIGSYDNHYLDYIFGPGEVSVIPCNSKMGFFWVQEFRPFNIIDREVMEAFRNIVLSLLVWQLKDTHEGSLIKSVLG
ncbi:hypothetical protein FQN50_007649 [Emmonsiellopsis sp. PD_5]|nr:hypothetical protein FQN50_007649 [Emmonsiellopsis sp. PD_5]